MTYHYFISDLHLDITRPDTLAAFHRFLETYRPSMASLYILGDLFEVWVGDDDDSPHLAAVADSIAAVTSSAPVYFMAGNRDFLLGADFAVRCGMQVLADPSVITIGNTRCVLSHGDQLCTDDVEYQRFRQMARSPQWIQGILGQPLAARFAIAQQLREKSLAHKSNQAENIMDANADAIAQMMRESTADCLIHGHTHRPARHVHGDRLRLVLGDWTDHAIILRIPAATEPSYELCRLDLATMAITPFN